MAKVENDWKVAAADARRDARHAIAVKGSAKGSQLLEVALKNLITLFVRINADFRAANRFLGENELVDLKKAVEIVVEQITANPKCDVETAKLRSKFLAAMIRATLQFERISVQLRR